MALILLRRTHLFKLSLTAVVAAAVLTVGWRLMPSAGAQVAVVNLTALDTPYVQDFDTLASTGTSAVTPVGWLFLESGANMNGVYTAGTGSSNTGDTYSFGSAGAAERAFGGLLSGSLTPLVGAAFVNNTGASITEMTIAYTGEQWRVGTAGRTDQLDFQFSTTATSLDTGTWIDVNLLDFTGPAAGPVGALDGNAALNRVILSADITGLAIPPGAMFFIRWTDFNATGADDGLAVDDFFLSVSGVPTTTNPTGTGAASPNRVGEGESTLLTVTVTPGANPASTGLTVTGDLTAIGGAPSQSFADDGTSGDVTPGDNVFSFLATIAAGTPAGVTSLPVAIADAQGRSSTASITLDVAAPVFVAISQVYGGGGNSGAPLRNDFIELINRGATTVNLAGWSVQYATSAGTAWQVTPLSGMLAPGGYYLVQEAAGTNTAPPLPAPDAAGGIAMAAGSGKVALVGSTTPLSGTCPLGTIDLVGYGAANCFEGTGPTPVLSNSTAAVRARGGCRDTNDNAFDFAAGSPAPRNTSSPPRDCTAPPLPLTIAEIQGNGLESPFLNREVRTSGIVTLLKFNGFFLQTPDADADADTATSDGLFVFTSISPTVLVGDAVSVIGQVDEFFGLTQVSTTSREITVEFTGQTLPSAVVMTPAILDPAGTPSQLERVEGMRVSAAELVSIAPTNGFGETFTVLAGVPRPLREPGIPASSPLPPGAPCCVPRFDENPERLMIDSDGRLGSTPVSVTTSVTFTGVAGPLDFTFGDYKVIPESAPAVSTGLQAQPVAAASADEFTVASFNVLNLFISQGNFPTKLAKISLAVRDVLRLPDVIGLEEVGDIATLTAVADRINADAVAAGGSNPGYRAFLLEGSSEFPGDDIDVGLLVRSRVTVSSVTQEGLGLRFTDPTEGDEDLLFERPPLVLRALMAREGSAAGTGLPVTIVVNHLQSLIDVDQDPGDGPRQRLKRQLQAEFVANLVQSLQNENLILVGDFNAFQFNDGYVDVIGTIRGAPAPADRVTLASEDLVDPNLAVLVETLPADQRYSFVFEGNAQTLDHVLVNQHVAGRLTRFVYARNNADFPESFAADTTRTERVSDHDMPVAYFRLPPAVADLEVAIAGTPSPVPAGSPLTLTFDVTNAGPDAATAVGFATIVPLGTTFASLEAPAGWTCATPNPGRFGLVVCSAPSIVALTAARLQLTVDVNCRLRDGVPLVAAAVATAASESSPADNAAAAIVRVSNRDGRACRP